MKKILQKYAVLIMALVIAFGCTACKNDGGGSSSVDPNAPIQGQITVWWPGADAQKSAIDAAKKKYEQSHEGVKINVSYRSEDNFYTSYAMVVGKNNEPDLFLLDSVYIQVLAHYFGDPALANIGDLAGEFLAENKDNYYASLYETGKFGSGYYALPYAANNFGLAYNKILMKRVLDKNGVEYDDTDIDACAPAKLGTKDEKFSMMWWCDQVKKYNDSTGSGLKAWTLPSGAEYSSVSALEYVSLLRRVGGSVMNADLSAVTMNTPENNELKTILNNLGATGVVESSFEEGRFEEGKILFIEEGCWKIDKYNTLMADPTVNGDFDIGWREVLTLKDGVENVGGTGLYSIAVSRRSKNMALALDFLKFLATDRETMLVYTEGSFQLPSLKGAFGSSDYYKTDDWKMFGDTIEKSVTRPATAIWTTMQNELNGLITGWLQNNSRVSDLGSVQTKLEKALKELNA